MTLGKFFLEIRLNLKKSEKSTKYPGFFPKSKLGFSKLDIFGKVSKIKGVCYENNSNSI
jgi:hypothetical protein